MTKNKTLTLDEIFEQFWDDYDNALSDDSSSAQEYESRFRQAILQWVADTLIGNNETQGFIATDGANRLRDDQRQVLKDHGWVERSD